MIYWMSRENNHHHEPKGTKMNKRNATSPWPFYGVDKQGRVVLFDVDTCDHCGREVIAPNHVGTGNTERELRRMGMTRRAVPAEEIYHSDDLGDCACETCCYEAEQAAAQAAVAPVAQEGLRELL